MPQHKSCEKRMRSAAKSRARNRAYRTKMRVAIRQFNEAQTGTEAGPLVHTASKIVDRLASKGIIHRNTAARKKSRMHARLQTLQG